MINNTIKSKITEALIQCEAPEVTVWKLQGITREEDTITIEKLYLCMGECTGEEFEAIREAKGLLEQEGINIINVWLEM